MLGTGKALMRGMARLRLTTLTSISLPLLMVAAACGNTLSSETPKAIPGQAKETRATKPGGSDATSEEELGTTPKVVDVTSMRGATGEGSQIAASASQASASGNPGDTSDAVKSPGAGMGSEPSVKPGDTNGPAGNMPVVTATATTSATASPTAAPTSQIIVAVGYGGLRGWSTDGVTFTMPNDVNGSNDDHLLYRDVVSGGGRVCAVGGGTQIAGNPNMARWSMSLDGKTWTHKEDQGQWLGSVQYIGGYFVTIGGFGRVLRSQDCVTWTETKAANSPAHFRNINQKNNTLVAFGDPNNTVKIFSNDFGLTWNNGDGGTGLSPTEHSQVTAFGSTVTIGWKELNVARGGTTTKVHSEAAPVAIILANVGGGASMPGAVVTVTPSPTTAPVSTNTYASVKSITTSYCVSCHGHESGVGSSTDAAAVAAFKAARQRAYCYVKSGDMPRGTTLGAADKSKLMAWIATGTDLAGASAVNTSCP